MMPVSTSVLDNFIVPHKQHKSRDLALGALARVRNVREGARDEAVSNRDTASLSKTHRASYYLPCTIESDDADTINQAKTKETS
jgi:hypothetical protein